MHKQWPTYEVKIFLHMNLSYKLKTLSPPSWNYQKVKLLLNIQSFVELTNGMWPIRTVNGTRPKFAECCKQDIVLLHIMIICIYWTTSGTTLNKTPRDYVVASNL